MSLLDAIFERRSMRRYKSEPVPKEVMRNTLEAGRLAPSADNAEPWHFVVVTDLKLENALSQGRWDSFVKDSAFTVVGCADKDNRWSTVDTTIAMQNMTFHLVSC